MSEFNYFRAKEFECKCGCGMSKMYHEFMRKLEIARGIAKTPFVINSGFRCYNHNENIGGSQTSSHPQRVAADIASTHDSLRWVIVEALKKAGFTRIGCKKTFIHVDDDIHKTQKVMWIY